MKSIETVTEECYKGMANPMTNEEAQGCIPRHLLTYYYFPTGAQDTIDNEKQTN